MGREHRLEIIQEIEEQRNSNVVTYITSDRAPISAQITEDAVLPLYRHLLAIAKANTGKDKIDLFIYSRGGDVSVPWRIVSMIREFCDEFSVLIPYRAQSAATMISMGADSIIMGRKAELGPIDPTLNRRVSGEASTPPAEISVEDVSSYISFMRERANISDQSALATVVSELANHLTPLTLGSVNRTYSHIRLVARKLLSSRKDKIDEERISAIVEALTEKIYFHGHAIARKEAKELRLPVEFADDGLEDLIWNLYEEYDSLLQFTSPIDPEQLLSSKNTDECTIGDYSAAIIESVNRLDSFEGMASFKRRRAIPSNIAINLNMPITGIDQNQLPDTAQAMIQHVMQQVTQAIPLLVQQELARQCPIQGYEIKYIGAKWLDRTSQPI
ncbi:MAG: hypothetical protein WCJ56_03765 [bacterium]